MKRQLVLFGGNSDIAQEFIRNAHDDIQFTIFSRNYEGAARKNAKVYELDITTMKPSREQLPEKIEGLVYFPGTVRLKPFKALKAEDFAEDFSINVQGAIQAIQAVLKKLNENSSIVLFSTVAVQRGMNYHSSVAASKGAIEGLTRSLAAELAPKIRVNAIAPSITETKIAERFINTDEKKVNSAQRHPLKRIGKPADIANMIDFLLSHKSSWITGQILAVDGGLSSI